MNSKIENLIKIINFELNLSEKPKGIKILSVLYYVKLNNCE